MFEESLVESTPLLHTHNRMPALLSLAAQLAAAAVILTLPVLHPELLPATRLLPATLTAPQPVPPPPPIHLKPTPVATSSSAPSALGAAYAPPRSDLLHLTGPAVDAPRLGIVNLGLRDSPLPPGINAAPGNPHVTVAPASKSSNAPTRISSGVSAGLLLAPIRPEYPAIARNTRTEGTVVIDAMISRSGSIERAHVLSGPALLQSAALAAVRQAHYRPFLLNGKPTEVQTTITINFKLGN
jgi:protein TonB